MTEDEAKTKWCPFVRITPENDHWWMITNREQRVSVTNEADVVTRCIGSACMAWVPEEVLGERLNGAGRCGLVGR